MALIDERLISLCSRGVLAEWDTRDQTLIDVYELQSLGKIKQALITDEDIVLYDSQQQVFKVFDLKTKSLKYTIHEHSQNPGYVNGLALSGSILGYIRGRSLIIHDLKEKNALKPRYVI
jgi:hypothetical protein